VRELHDRDLRSRWQGIDTGFGIMSQPILGENAATVSGIKVVDAAAARGQEQEQVVEGEVDDPEAIRLEMLGLGDGTRQV
jgi:hypothetical protein